MREYDPEQIDRDQSYDGFLGVKLLNDLTEFYIWAPLADAVTLNLYINNDDEKPHERIALAKGDCGVWSCKLASDLQGMFYTYEYTYGDEVSEGVDPYATAVGVNGEKGAIISLSAQNPEGWEDTDYVSLEKYTDAVLYELHVRDFSADQASGVPEECRGKFKAFTLEGTKSPSGKATCLDYIKDLGVTHVHLLPVFDYDRLNERDPQSSYNWGYDPQNYNCPEGSYSADPCDPALRVKELKELVMSLHKKGIGVVMDVVYNHTFKLEESVFGKAFPGYYYRYVDLHPSNGSGCGSEIASERAMVRKYIVDSVLFWAKEYKIDGFRFDLMAVLDVDTMNEISARLKEINPSVILYGEGWSGGQTALSHERSASKYNANKTPDYAYFNDNYRDAIKGGTFSDEALGYISGNYHLKATVISGLLGQEGWAPDPCQIINYCEAHDNLTLWDKLMVSASSYHERDRKKMARLAMALVLLAQGVPFVQAGQEFLRSKPIGDGRFDHNSYSSPDSINSLKWAMLDVNASEVDYFKQLVDFRKAHRLLRMPTREEVGEHSAVLPSPDGTIAIKLFDGDEELLIYVNPIPRAKMFLLPDGEWELLVSDTMASSKPLAIYCEGVFLPPISAMVLRRLKC